MKFGLALVVTLPLVGCSQDSAQRSPTAPAPPVSTPSPAPTPGWVTYLPGFVVDPSGECIEGATVQVVAGQAVGRSVTQETPCDAWGDYANIGGFEFTNLTPGVEMTLRASAPGWSTCEKTVVPTTAFVVFWLSKTSCEGFLN